MTHEQCIQKAKELYAAMDELAGQSPVGLWEDECSLLEDLIADMAVSYSRRMDELADALPSDFDQHNTMNHTMQGTR